MLDRAGQQVGPYRLMRLVGASPFGEVYIAEQAQTRATTAVKVLKLQLPPETLRIFINEAQALKLQQPHIMRLRDLGIAGDIPFLVMDYTPNGSLRQRFPRGSRIPLELIANYLQQIAQALQFAHTHGLIHRNVKPENMLVWQENYILLSDFSIGIVDHLQRSLNRPEMSASIPYIAPEQLQGRAQPASDQYALAAVAYEWLCGVPPFQGAAADMMAQKLSAGPLPLRTLAADLPTEVERVVRQAMARDPQARFPSVEAFEQAFHQATTMRTAPVSTTPSAPTPSVQEPAIEIPAIPVPPTEILSTFLASPTVETDRIAANSDQPAEGDQTQIDERIGERIRIRKNALRDAPEPIPAESSVPLQSREQSLEGMPTWIDVDLGDQIRARKNASVPTSSFQQAAPQTTNPDQNVVEDAPARYNPIPSSTHMSADSYQLAPQTPGVTGSNTFPDSTPSVGRGRKSRFALILIIIILIILIIVGSTIIFFPAVLHKL